MTNLPESPFQQVFFRFHGRNAKSACSYGSTYGEVSTSSHLCFTEVPAERKNGQTRTSTRRSIDNNTTKSYASKQIYYRDCSRKHHRTEHCAEANHCTFCLCEMENKYQHRLMDRHV
eukprot:g29924.t1